MSKRLKRFSLQLESLPDEILLEIFSYMDFQELLLCSQVSKRIRAICSDKSYWEEMDLFGKRVKAEFIKSILDRNCELLIMRDTVIEGCVKLNRPSKLTHLELTGWFHGSSTKDFYHEILNSCYSLEVLVMNGVTHKLNIVFQNLCKRNGQTLQGINLAECKWISKRSVQGITKNCTHLTEVNLRLVKMPQEAMDLLVSGLSPNVKKVNFASKYMNMRNSHIEALLSRSH